MSKRDKFLTEVMGRVYREKDFIDIDHTRHPSIEKAKFGKSISFSTWQGFGELWEWAKRQEWWDYFADLGLARKGHRPYLIPIGIIEPSRFADAIYEYLLSQEEK